MEIADRRLDSAAMVDLAAASGHVVTLRSLELWRHRGLLPRPDREPGGRAVWLYPTGSEKQLLRLLYWRQRARYLDEVALALWIEGFAIDTRQVSESLERFLDQWEAMIEAELGRAAGDNEEALIDALARKVARMRGEEALPRLSRQSLADRERACGYLAAAIFGSEAELAKREDDLPHLERLLGLRRGHGGGLAPLLSLRDQDGVVARLPTPTQAREALASVRNQELELARAVVQLFLFVLPKALPLLFADQPVKALAIVEFAERAFSEPVPGLLPFLVIVLVVSIRAKEPSLEELAEHLQTLDPQLAGPELRQVLELSTQGAK